MFVIYTVDSSSGPPLAQTKEWMQRLECTRSIRLGLVPIHLDAIRVAAHYSKRALVLGFYHAFEVHVVTPFVHRVMPLVSVTIHASNHILVFRDQVNHLLIVPKIVSIIDLILS